MSTASLLRRSFLRRARTPITLLDQMRDGSGTAIRSGRLHATSKAVYVPVANLTAVWGERRLDAKQAAGGAQQEAKNFVQFLPDALQPSITVRPEMKVLRGHFTASDAWDEKQLWDIVTFGLTNEIDGHQVMQLDLAKHPQGEMVL